MPGSREYPVICIIREGGRTRPGWVYPGSRIHPGHGEHSTTHGAIQEEQKTHRVLHGLCQNHRTTMAFDDPRGSAARVAPVLITLVAWGGGGGSIDFETHPHHRRCKAGCSKECVLQATH